MTNEFFDKVKEEMESEGIDFKTEDDIADQILLQNAEEAKKLEDKKKKLIEIMSKIEAKVKIRVTEITQEQLTLNQERLIDDMNNTMVLHSKVIDDVFDLERALEELKVVQNSLVCLLHHGFKFRNKLKIKGAKELDTYISSDYTYNEVNVRVKKLQYLIERGNNYSRLISRKLDFLKEISQTQRSKIYRESKENG